MSAVVFAGAAQYAAITVLAAGGDVATAIVAGTLLNSRFIPMSLAMTPSMPAGRGRRALMALGLTDPGWALSARTGGRFDAHFMVGVLLPQYALWQAGTVFGVVAGGLIGGPEAYGLDVVLPAFFLTILVGGELRRDRVGIATAALGGLIALALVPFAPPGLPLIMASLAALVVLVGPWRETSPEEGP